MQMISCHNGRLYTVNQAEGSPSDGGFATGLPALDGLLPGGLLARGSVHEVLAEPRHGTPMTFALLLAKAALQLESPAASPRDAQPDKKLPLTTKTLVWCDPDGTLYPPAVAARGIPLRQLFLVRPQAPADLLWSAAECMGCQGVAATIAPLGKLSRVEARRLQLAAERGGGVGILLRPAGRASAQYAAATRWLVAPQPGERTVQKWKIQLIHGHGDGVGKSVILEHHRGEAHPLRAVADSSSAKTTGIRGVA